MPRLTTLAAIATSLFLESSGFGTGLYRYLKLRLVDVKSARSMILITLPLGALGSIVALFVPVLILKIGYGVAMLGLAYLLVSDQPEPAQVGAPIRPVGGASGVVAPSGLIGAPDQPPPVVIVAESEHVHAPCHRVSTGVLRLRAARSMTSAPTDCDCSACSPVAGLWSPG